MALRETQDKLEGWGKWMRGGIGLGYGNVLSDLRGGGLPSAPISDDQALRIDRVVAVLKQTNYEQYQCIKLCYEGCMAVRSIAREIKISHQTVTRRIEAAEHWLDVAFEVENI